MRPLVFAAFFAASSVSAIVSLSAQAALEAAAQNIRLENLNRHGGQLDLVIGSRGRILVDAGSRLVRTQGQLFLRLPNSVKVPIAPVRARSGLWGLDLEGAGFFPFSQISELTVGVEGTDFPMGQKHKLAVMVSDIADRFYLSY